MSAVELTEEDIVREARTLDLRGRTDDEVVACIAARWGVTTAELLEKDRARGSRQAARRELYETLHALGRSWPYIGRLVGRHHASCFQAVAGKRRMHAVRGEASLNGER